MNILPIVDILQDRIYINSEITVQGWVRTRRDSKAGISFLSIYDGSCYDPLQIIINNTLSNYKDEILHITTGCSVTITGKIVNSPGKGQNVEIYAKTVKILGWVDDPNTYPMSAKSHKIEFLRTISHLRPRSNIIGAVSRVRHSLMQAIHKFMNENGFFWVSSPIITTANTEGAGEMFRISTLNLENLPRTKEGLIDYKKDFFKKESFLTVSGQLNGEAYACALSKIYTFGPTFRAENTNSHKHLSEFWMVEPEVAFFDLDDIITLAISLLKYVFQYVLNERNDDMNFFQKRINNKLINRLEQCINNNLIQVEYTEVINILQKHEKYFKKQISWGDDFSSEHERYLTEKYFNSPIVIKNYPKDIKAFYMRINEDGKTVSAMDILFQDIGEIIGGSQREERLIYLDQRLYEIGLNKKDYWWYRDLRRYGTVPHSGFGLGFERLIAYITGMKNIRDVIPFPRTSHNANF